MLKAFIFSYWANPLEMILRKKMTETESKDGLVRLDLNPEFFGKKLSFDFQLTFVKGLHSGICVN